MLLKKILTKVQFNQKLVYSPLYYRVQIKDLFLSLHFYIQTRKIYQNRKQIIHIVALLTSNQLFLSQNLIRASKKRFDFDRAKCGFCRNAI